MDHCPIASREPYRIGCAAKKDAGPFLVSTDYKGYQPETIYAIDDYPYPVPESERSGLTNRVGM